MVITSENKPKKRVRYLSSQITYAFTYVIITVLVLLFLNIYSTEISQRLFYSSKKTAMIEKCLMASTEISNLEVLNNATVGQVVNQMTSLRDNRLIITDQFGIAVYDSMQANGTVGQYVLLPEITQALSGNDVFTWDYHDGSMVSRAATPIVSYGTLVGCIYMLEYDSEQGALILSLQNNILGITMILEIFVVLFSIFFANIFSYRLKKIMSSMQVIREGDYSHRVSMGGRDELSVLSREFNDLVARLQISEQKRRNFVSDASHELKTPLASIKLLSDSILQNDMDLDTVKEFVGDIGNEADRLNRMTQKLLSLSKVESQADSDCEIIYISPTVDRVLRMLEAIAAKNKVTIVRNYRTDSSILTIEDDLYQIVFNLVENGIKYNVPGGTLTITLDRTDDNAIIQVCDTGVGIPPDSLSHIFERFYRVDKARSRKSGGSGLGLSIVRSIVQRNRGTITVESTVGEGSVFTVSFPIFDTEVEDL